MSQQHIPAQCRHWPLQSLFWALWPPRASGPGHAAGCGHSKLSNSGLSYEAPALFSFGNCNSEPQVVFFASSQSFSVGLSSGYPQCRFLDSLLLWPTSHSTQPRRCFLGLLLTSTAYISIFMCFQGNPNTYAHTRTHRGITDSKKPITVVVFREAAKWREGIYYLFVTKHLILPFGFCIMPLDFIFKK